MNSQEIMEPVAAEAVAENKNHAIFKKSFASKLFLAYVIAVGAMVLTYSLSSLITFFFFGATGLGAISAVRVSALAWTRLGYMGVALVHAPKTVVLIIAFVSIIKLFTKKDTFSADHINMMSKIPAVLHLYSLFSLIDCGFFAVAAVANPFAESVFAFKDMLNLYGIFGFEVESVNLVVKILFVAIVVGYGIFQFLMYGTVKNAYSEIEGAARNEGYLSSKKVNVVLPMIYAGINFVFAVFMFINGSWISALMNLSLAAYLVINTLYLNTLYKKIFVQA